MSRHVALGLAILAVAAAVTTPAAAPATPKDPKLQMAAKGLFHTGRFFYTPKGRWVAVRVYAKHQVRPKTSAQLERMAARYAPYDAVLTIGGHRLELDRRSTQLPRQFSWLLGSFRAVTDEEAAAPATLSYRDAAGRHKLPVKFPSPE
jgi:hypothetical protein